MTSKLRLVCVLALAGGVMLGLHCGDDKGPGPQLQLVIIPDSLTLEISCFRTFDVDYDGDRPKVRWYVNGIPGGDPWIGMITTEGLYVAPDSLPSLFGLVQPSVTLRAVAVEDATVEAEATIFITREDTTAFVNVTPDTATVLVADSIEFSSEVSGCPTTEVVWSVAAVAGDADSIGTIRTNGTYVAPLAAGSTFDLMVRATSVSCPEKSGVAKVLVAGAAKAFDVELEDYTDHLDLGGYGISVSYCGAASKQHAVEGLDIAGEYLEVPVRVPGTGTYIASVWYSTNIGFSIEVQVTVIDAGPLPQEDSYLLDQGSGIG
ncbi:MAG: hypothetical protein ABIJ00_11565 [Candidatus Eisenbacteria bacterium]